MLKYLVAGVALALFTLPALAQDKPHPPISLDQQVDQAEKRLYAAQADFYLLVAKQKQAASAEAATAAAATAAWWGSWWAGMYPPPAAPALDATPQK